MLVLYMVKIKKKLLFEGLAHSGMFINTFKYLVKNKN